MARPRVKYGVEASIEIGKEVGDGASEVERDLLAWSFGRAGIGEDC